MLYEKVVSGDEAFVCLSWFSPQLSFKGRYRFIMSFDRRHAWKYGT